MNKTTKRISLAIAALAAVTAMSAMVIGASAEDCDYDEWGDGRTSDEIEQEQYEYEMMYGRPYSEYDDEDYDDPEPVNSDSAWKVEAHYDSGKEAIQNESGTLRSEARYSILNASAGVDSESQIGSVDKFLSGENDGNGVNALAGAKVSVAEAGFDSAAGTEDYNVKGGAAVTAASAEANVGAGIAIKDGKLNIGAQAGAEANLVDLKVNAGGTVGGVEMGVEGGVKVGIGAKAQAGFVNGKLMVGLDAALGLGLSLKAEVDVGAIGQKVADGATYVYNGAQKIYRVIVPERPRTLSESMREF